MDEIACATCGCLTTKKHPMQKYCSGCSTEADIKRKRLWAKNNPQKPRHGYGKRRDQIIDARGREISKEVCRPIAWAHDEICLEWMVRVSVPFSYDGSKNHIYTKRRSGHIALRRESTAMRDGISAALADAIGGRKIAHNRLWLDILVQKSDHRGDAINFVDLVCDAVKRAVPVDDRWFSIRRLDWEISKVDPKIFIGIGQEKSEDASVCSSCGRVLPLGAFTKNSHTILGVSRNCRECSSRARSGAKLPTRGAGA